MPDAYPCYVIPPYILRRIVDRGSLQQQRCAQNTLSHVQTLMAHVPGRPAAPHVTTPGLLERDIYDAHLEAVSPLATLARGYSVTSASDGKVLKQTKQVREGDVLTTRLNDGWVESEVKNITPVKKTRSRKKAG